jgi:DNA-binding IscR family transcriptional regulator
MTLEAVVAAVRGAGENHFNFSSVDTVIRRIDTAISQALCNQTIKDLVVESQREKLPQRLQKVTHD